MSSTIFIVDDEKNIRRTVRMVLEGEGFGVEEASSGEEALARLPEVAADVMLLDVQLPGISGLETLERISKLKNPETLPTIIVISGHATLADAVRATKAGAYDLIEKPLDRERLMVALRNALERRAMAREVEGLRALADERSEMVGRSAAMMALQAQIAKVAPTRTRVLITGESGTGKELIARAIHRQSAVAGKPLVKVNCAAIPKELIESELFGHERGAFTGAIKRKLGRFELADKGTLFLDEIGDVTPGLQLKLLRVLQEREFERVGGEETIKVDVRVVSATHRDIAAEAAAGRFREDLFYRLHVVPCVVPPLRERKDDIPRLCAHFIAKLGPRTNATIDPRNGISDGALARLGLYSWPGNVRELENVIEQALVFAEGTAIDVGALPASVRGGLPENALALPGGEMSLPALLEDLERQLIQRAYDKSGGVKTETARLLGIKTSALYYKLEKYGIGVIESRGDKGAAAAADAERMLEDGPPGGGGRERAR
jgi:two-component system response regulator HydG